MNWEVKFSYQVLSDVYLKGTYASIGLNQTLSKEKGQPVYAIYEDGGLIVHDDQIESFGHVDLFE